MELLDALKLQYEWGADEALLDEPADRRHAPAAPLAFAAPQSASPEAAQSAPRAPAQNRANAAPRRTPQAAAAPAGPEDARKLAASAQNLEELETAMRGFTGCALRDTATQLVFADGAEDARLVIIGEAPGADEDRAGKAFTGPAGELLDKMLGSIGLDRTKVRLINIVPWRPPGNRPLTESEIALCLPFLHRQIALIAPQALLVLGGIAAKALLGTVAQGGIRRLRGKWQQAEIEGIPAPLPCLPSYHPSYLLNTPSAKREAWQDFLNLSVLLKTHN